MFQYRLISFSQITSDSLPGEVTWFRYEIANQFNSITGYRSGEIQHVKSYVKNIIDYQNNKLQFNNSGFEIPSTSSEVELSN